MFDELGYENRIEIKRVQPLVDTCQIVTLVIQQQQQQQQQQQIEKRQLLYDENKKIFFFLGNMIKWATNQPYSLCKNKNKIWTKYKTSIQAAAAAGIM